MADSLVRGFATGTYRVVVLDMNVSDHVAPNEVDPKYEALQQLRACA